MQIQQNVPLKDYTTMHLGGPARAMVTITSKQELAQAIKWAQDQNLPVLAIGEGSNLIVRDEGFDGLIILNRILGFEISEDTMEYSLVRIGAGEHWDSVVAKTVELGLSGIELLSAIPGTAGATPVQNVGAYGAEIADTFVELEAYNQLTSKFVTLKKDDCKFSYRNSIFKPLKSRHYIITSITLKLKKTSLQPPFYARLQTYIDQNNIIDFSPKSIRNCIITIRKVILPDPKLIANTGSFFKNPIILANQFQHLQIDYPEMPHYDMPNNQVKIPAGWLIDQTGLKGYSAHGMKIYEKNALVFVNENAKNYQDLAAFKTEVIERVNQKFGIILEQEPETIPE